MAQVPVPPQGYPQPLQSQQQQQQQLLLQQQFPGQQLPRTMNMGTPGTVLPNGQFVANMNMPGTPGAMNMGTPGTVLPNGQFVPNVMPGTPGGMNMGTPVSVAMPTAQVVQVPAPVYSTGGAVYAPSQGTASIGGVGNVEEGGIQAAPVITREQQQFVGVPRGMTRESMQPGYDPRLEVQRRVFNPAWSFRDSFGNTRGKKCCTIS